MEQYVGLDVSLKETSSAWWIKRARPCGKASVRRPLSALPLSSPEEHLERPGSALRAGYYRPGTGTRSKRWVCRWFAWMRAMSRQHDDSGNWFRSYGNENWEFDEHGLMRLCIASINDAPIKESERKYLWPLGRRPDDHPSLSDLGL